MSTSNQKVIKKQPSHIKWLCYEVMPQVNPDAFNNPSGSCERIERTMT